MSGFGGFIRLRRMTVISLQNFLPSGASLECNGAVMEEFARYLRRLKQFLRHRGRTDEDADDLIQEAFLRLELYGRENKVLEPEAFLVRAVANLSVDKYRHDGVIQFAEKPVEDLDVFDTTPQPDEVCASRERLDKLIAGMNQLSPKSREILMARRYEGLSCPEIAKRHGVTVSAIEKSLARAMLHLVDWMDGYD
jgi:RNA polymerase sigma factor (sigma-70 family)